MKTLRFTLSAALCVAVFGLGATSSSANPLPKPAAAETSCEAAIRWPTQYLPGQTDNFVSNEVIVKGLSVADLWPYLVDTRAWPAYYDNASDIRFYDGRGPRLSAQSRFRFTTFGFPVEAQVVEFVAPTAGKPARIAWHGWVEGDAAHRLDVHHAWLLEDLPGHRVRILTQESQLGQPARDLAGAQPNPMLNKHQAWLDGLVKAAKAHVAIH
jgi:hypothetical protein